MHSQFAANNTADSPSTELPPTPPQATWRIILLLILVGLGLYVPGIRWGLPATVSWSQDSISDFRTLGAVEGWPGHWQGRYPPLHYLLLYSVYQPTLQDWRQSGVLQQDDDTGQITVRGAQDERIGLLILIARIVSISMAIGAGIGIWASARRLLKNESASVLAAVSMMCGAAYVYFAHVANVDIPSIFWFSWSLYFYTKLLSSRRNGDAMLLGLFGSLAISTKDSVAGIYPGMALILVFLEWRHYRDSIPFGRALLYSLAQKRWALGILAFVLPYLLINGAFHNWDSFIIRLQYWLAPSADTLHAQQTKYPNQWSLFLGTLYQAAGAVGWPMLAAMLLSISYTVRRNLRIAMVLLIPACSYYLVVIAPLGFVYPRFLLPPLACFSILTGYALVDIAKRLQWPIFFRLAPIVGVLAPTVGYALAMNAAMLTDTRYQAEAWFQDNVPRPSSVGAFAMKEEPTLRPQYLPRVNELGYATYPVVMARDWFDRPQPEQLILSSFNYEDFDDDQRACMNELVAGKLGYEPIAEFRGEYLGARASWLSLAGWGTPTPGKISPELAILQRRKP